MVSVAASPAEARRRHVSKGGGYNPPYSDMVVDAKTGRVLHAVNEDALRHPASVTKVMTLYLLFEQLEKGRYSLDSELKVSAHAQAQAPSKIGVRAGQTIEVEDAIKALVTKSANDVAVVVAENIGGSEDEFADMMTRKARQLGMTRTVYKNASGLPDPAQVTTARDLVTLGRALQDRFPRYYTYFRTPSFTYRGQTHRNHNHLLGRVEGMDGIKTGYTRASGFNLLTSVKTEGRHVVAVVLGGRSAAARDNQMASLLDDTIERAYAGARTAPPMGEGAAPVAVADASPQPRTLRSAYVEDESPATTAAVSPKQAARPNDPPALVLSPPAAVPATTTPTANVRPAPVQVAANAPVPVTLARPAVVAASGAATTTPSSGGNMKWVVGAPSRGEADTKTSRAEAKPGKAEKAEPKVEASRIPKSALSGWVIQLGATDDEAKARQILAKAKAKTKSGVLAKADPFTEKVSKGGETLYRARFSGFDEDKAASACKQLKRTGFACMVVRGG
ncbi:SPOR domain-containing protein [Alsobacter sp. SYSU M60028]|uniref:SPOR domain-containing protein n=1 Tax=Alsobacter ponti TaxID=2962936 RepID=A0ABT1LFJ5_9HYPH|nr:serine hydrolase [Alsobacter ponti]MCP8939883.1 SPOR domain-containing protein [Alsobacter ponti]